MGAKVFHMHFASARKFGSYYRSYSTVLLSLLPLQRPDWIVGLLGPFTITYTFATQCSSEILAELAFTVVDANGVF